MKKTIITRQPILDENQKMVMFNISEIKNGYNGDTFEQSNINKEEEEKTLEEISNKDSVLKLDNDIQKQVFDFLDCDTVLLPSNLDLTNLEENLENLIFLDNIGWVIDNKQKIKEETIKKLQGLNENNSIFVLENVNSIEEIDSKLIDLIDYVIIDIVKQQNINISNFNKRIKIKYDNQIKTIAKNISTKEEFRLAKEVGFDFFQGLFFKKPDKINTEIPGHQNNYVTLLRELNNEDLKFERLKEIIQRDMSMTESLLRTINNAYIGHEISSIKDAAIMLGVKGLKKWSMVYLVQGLGANKPDVLFINALSRANMAERLSVLFGEEDKKDEYFIMGMFSIIDVFVDMDKELVLNKIGLKPQITKAIMNFEGTMGEVLSIVEPFDNASRKAIKKIKNKYPKKIKNIYTTYLESLNYANEVFMGIKNL